MTKEQILNSEALIKRFCKDCNLSINIYSKPYFYERLQAIDPVNDCVKMFNIFCEDLSTFENEQEYFEHYNKIKDSVINFIKSSDDFNAFNNTTFQYDLVASRRNLYIDENDGKSFISIDMKKANFSALKHFSSQIFDNCETWEEFISKFTDSRHIINSKYIRQVILGACNPKRQTTYEHFLMNTLCKHIIDNMSNISIYSLSEDEIIIEVPNSGFDFSLDDLRKLVLKCVIKDCPNSIGELVRIDSFELYKVNDGWMKIYNDDSDKIEFKCLDSEIYHQIVKHYLGEPITDNDLIFYHNGKLAKFLSEVDNPWL